MGKWLAITYTSFDPATAACIIVATAGTEERAFSRGAKAVEAIEVARGKPHVGDPIPERRLLTTIRTATAIGRGEVTAEQVAAFLAREV